MLIEEEIVPDTALPVEAFKAHLRLGTGFTETDVQEPVLIGFLRAAIATIEARTNKVLLRRSFSYSLSRWRDATGEVLPLAPVTQIDEMQIVDATGAAVTIDPVRYGLEEDAQRPRAVALGSAFALIPSGGKAVFQFQAGFGEDWDAVPSDLAQAVFLLAAHYYEYRDETSLARGCMPFGVQTLIERYRPMRLFTGGVA